MPWFIIGQNGVKAQSRGAPTSGIQNSTTDHTDRKKKTRNLDQKFTKLVGLFKELPPKYQEVIYQMIEVLLMDGAISHEETAPFDTIH
ncbi:hypothetical protein FACS1894109_00110 [Spirochaetia bacterium]|nr:hypothetical protein FACS1894109_00110 [Spirochaetia bacterium]